MILLRNHLCISCFLVFKDWIINSVAVPQLSGYLNLAFKEVFSSSDCSGSLNLFGAHFVPDLDVTRNLIQHQNPG